MTVVLVIIAVVLACVAISASLVAARANNSSAFWFEKWSDEATNNIRLTGEVAALVQGDKELEESYQMQILSYHDRLVAETARFHQAKGETEYWKGKAEELEEIRLRCQLECLPRIDEQIVDTSPD